MRTSRLAPAGGSPRTSPVELTLADQRAEAPPQTLRPPPPSRTSNAYASTQASPGGGGGGGGGEQPVMGEALRAVWGG